MSEGAALAAVGPDGTLIVAKTKSARATCALGLAPAPIVMDDAGQPQGRLLIVGTGPGSDGWMTAESEAAIAAATDLVGYTLYLDILGPRADGKTRHDFPLGEEIDRVRAALEIAATGRTVALVSSGDPQAMATLAFELLEPADGPTGAGRDRGLSRHLARSCCCAVRASGARFFFASDLLTPWTHRTARPSGGGR